MGGVRIVAEVRIDSAGDPDTPPIRTIEAASPALGTVEREGDVGEGPNAGGSLGRLGGGDESGEQSEGGGLRLGS